MTIFRRVAAATATMTAALTAAGSALALSCAPPSIEGSYKGWADAPERYYVVSGTLTPVSPLPDVPSPGDLSIGGGEAPDLRAVYRVQGEVVYAQQTVPIDHYIWVRATCFGPWCAGFPGAGSSGVMGLKQLPDYTLELGMSPCGGSVFQDGGGTVKARVQQCMGAGGCTPPGPGR